MKKRILPALLALCMVMSLLPVAFADGCTGDSPANENCAEETHVAGCPKKCAKCTKTTGHTDAHAGSACTNDSLCPATDNHESTCPKKCTFGDCKLSANHDGEHKNDTCPGTTDAGHDCGAADGTHKKGCASYTACGAGAVDGRGGCTKCEGHDGKHEGTKCTGDDQCPASVHDAECDSKCTLEGCDLTKDHTQKHKAGTACPNDEDDKRCSASTHGDNCTLQCDTTGCTKTVNHTDKHEGTDCTKDSRCPATTHTAPKYTTADGGTIKTAGCPKFVACSVCTRTGDDSSGWTPKEATHEDDHNNTEKCLGYANDKRCGADGHHIAGCPNYCTCTDHEGCTHQAGCPGCAELAECTCPVCTASANPGLGVVTDENGEAVDPAEPTEPTIPTKAEDFTDMEDWMAADVQTVLDKGWMQGEGETFNGRGVTKGATIAAVLARMDGETITGTDWDKDALAWAEGKDVFEGVELTGESMARKDLVLVIWRMADKPDSDFELTFTDVDGLEGDHLTAMKWAAENGIVKGNGDDTVTPDGSVTRAALCAMLARYDGLEK